MPLGQSASGSRYRPVQCARAGRRCRPGGERREAVLLAVRMTQLVCMPMSLASGTTHAIADDGIEQFFLRRSAPVAATSAMAIAIEVSSVHLTGLVVPKAPPPTIAASRWGHVADQTPYGAPSASPAAVANSGRRLPGQSEPVNFGHLQVSSPPSGEKCVRFWIVGETRSPIPSQLPTAGGRRSRCLAANRFNTPAGSTLPRCIGGVPLRRR